MTKQEPDRPTSPARVLAHAKLLEAAMAWLGVREIMGVFSNWQERDEGLDPYRLATTNPENTATTSSANTFRPIKPRSR